MTLSRFMTAATAVICLSATAIAAPGYVGVYLEDSDTGNNGAAIQDVAPGSPAAKAGLRQGDLIIEWNGNDVSGSQVLIPYLKRSQSGQTIQFAITRDGWRKALKMTLASAPATRRAAPRSALPAPKERGYLGIYLTQGDGGEPIIDGVLAGSPAQRDGLRKGDEVLAVNGKTVTDSAGMIAEVGQFGPKDTVAFRVRRSGQVRTVRVRLTRRPGEGATKVTPKLTPAPRVEAPRPATGKRSYIGLALDDSAGKGPLKVDDVKAQGPADRYGIRKGDVLIKVDGKALKTVEDFVRAFRAKSPGQKMVFRIQRDGWQHDVPVVIGAR
ncbi:MAG: PDZ domain-containing protein [Planctomycetes bacterium]|nr:PDZ domain-containing protein [Planctomycetota bacterium]